MQRSKLHSLCSPVHRWTGEKFTPEWSETMAARKKKSSGRKKTAGRKTARKSARKSTGRKTARKSARKSSAKKRKR
ncbi:MAG: hypothetical protein ACR2L6_08595 [Gemmatimonadaceae bacterium]